MVGGGTWRTSSDQSAYATLMKKRSSASCDWSMKNFHIYERNTSVGLITQAALCLALNVYHEARSENYDGQMAVAQVTLNRVASEKYPDSICDVVWQPRQFSWTHDGKSDTPRDPVAWAIAENISRIAMEGHGKTTLEDSVMFYHATYAQPYWSKLFVRTAQYGTHIFYKENNG